MTAAKQRRPALVAAADEQDVVDPVVAEPDDEETPEARQARERAELNAAVIELRWNEQLVGTVPKRRGRWPSRAGRLFEEEKFAGALQSLLGEEDYDRLETEICPFIDDLNEFADYAGKMLQKGCVP